MPESAQQWYARVRAAIDKDGYREAAWPQWPTWPLKGGIRPRALRPPDGEPSRSGAGGVGCVQCEKSRTDDPSTYLFWRDELAMLGAPFGGSSLPLCCFLMTRRHADLSDLTTEEAGRIGELQMYLERATCEVLDVPRVQIARWGDGAEHLHWAVFARPTGATQLRGTFLTMWDDLLPLRDPAALRADLDRVAARLVELAGGEALPDGAD